MAHLSQVSLQRRSKLANAVGKRKATPDEIAALRQSFNASALADYFEHRLALSPLLTPEQYDDLHAVINRHGLAGKVSA